MPQQHSAEASIQRVAFAAEKRAMMSLGAVMQNTTIPRVLTSVRFIQHRLSSPSRSPRGAAAALASTTDAMKDCRIVRVQLMLREAERSLRDVVVTRVQLCLPLGDRDLFTATLEEAFAPGNYDLMLHSQLMNSYKYQFSDIPGAFPSNAEIASKTVPCKQSRSSRSEKAPSEVSTCTPTDTSSEAGSATAWHPTQQGQPLTYYMVRPMMLVQPRLPEDKPELSQGAPYISGIDLRGCHPQAWWGEDKPYIFSIDFRGCNAQTSPKGPGWDPSGAHASGSWT